MPFSIVDNIYFKKMVNTFFNFILKYTYLWRALPLEDLKRSDSFRGNLSLYYTSEMKKPFGFALDLFWF